MSNSNVSKIGKEVIEALILTPIPAAAALSQFDPTYAAIWAFTTTFLNQMTKDEREVFVEELSKREVKEELFGSVEFARASKVTFEAAANTASEEKIRMLARLLRVGTNEELISNFDVYKEFAKLVDDISPTEFSILLAIEKSTAKYPNTSDPAQQSVNRKKVWDEAKESIENETNISSEALQGLMNRIARTGCVTSSLSALASGYVGTSYSLSPLYFELKQYIAEGNPT